MTIETQTTQLGIRIPFTRKEAPTGPVTQGTQLWTIENIGGGIFSIRELQKMMEHASDDSAMVVGGLTVVDPDTISFRWINSGAPVELDPPKTLTREEINKAGFRTLKDGVERAGILVWKPTRPQRQRAAELPRRSNPVARALRRIADLRKP